MNIDINNFSISDIKQVYDRRGEPFYHDFIDIAFGVDHSPAIPSPQCRYSRQPRFDIFRLVT